MGKALKEMTLQQLWDIFPIMIEEYNPEWKTWYQEEIPEIIHAVGKENVRRINHIGSTAVAGLAAKPTIDILLEISDTCDLYDMICALERLGYIYEQQPYKPAPHMMFMKGYTPHGFAERVFHLHIRYVGDWDELYFRDYLQAHEDCARQYAELKKKLKCQYEHNRDGYTTAKTEFIHARTQLARREFGTRYLMKNQCEE